MLHTLPIALLIALLGLNACNTMEGVGRDMEEAGEQIEEEANS